MRRALELARRGRGQITAVVGEPGVGKSRLCYEFKILERMGCKVLEAYSVSHGKAYPYLPITELLKGYLQIALEDDEQIRREKVAGKVVALDRSLEDTLPYIFFLLGIPDPDSSLQQMDAAIRRQRTFDAIKRLLLRESLSQPLIVIFEDLHWIDSETQAFLDVLQPKRQLQLEFYFWLITVLSTVTVGAVRHTIPSFGSILSDKKMLKSCSPPYWGVAMQVNACKCAHSGKDGRQSFLHGGGGTDAG